MDSSAIDNGKTFYSRETFSDKFYKENVTSMWRINLACMTLEAK